MRTRRSRVFFITGAAGGNGAATARLAAALGHKVVIADINLQGARLLAAELGPQAFAVPLDICSRDQWRAALNEVWRRYGRLDVLVNNALLVKAGFARNVSLREHEQTLATNFMGPLIGTLMILPRFKEQGHGHVVTVCSMTAFVPFPGMASYAAANHALRAFHHGVALEESDAPISFTIVHPADGQDYDTARAAEAAVPGVADAWMTPEQIAKVTISAIKNKRIEVLLPTKRGKAVRLIGNNAKGLRRLLARGTAHDADRILIDA
jgi:NAD(P)-dependent dehydrogenase (short-subunit alcohol dehydrogenase family)